CLPLINFRSLIDYGVVGSVSSGLARTTGITTRGLVSRFDIVTIYNIHFVTPFRRTKKATLSAAHHVYFLIFNYSYLTSLFCRPTLPALPLDCFSSPALVPLPAGAEPPSAPV